MCSEGCGCDEESAPSLLEPEEASALTATGTVLLLPMEKGSAGWTRSGHGWATTAGVLQPDGKIRRTKDREGEFMLAAEKPGGIDFSDYLARGFLNDSHRSIPAPGATCNGRCRTGKPDANCAAHGGKQWSVLIGVPDKVEHAGPGSDLTARDGKVGWYSWFHLFDRDDPRSWANPDGTPRKRMLRDGTCTADDVQPTAKELDRADWFWTQGLQMQREGRTLGQSIQGWEVPVPCGAEKCIVRAGVKQNALIEFPHNPDATVEGLGREMAKGEAPIVLAFARRLMQDVTLRRRFQLQTIDQAIIASRRCLKNLGVYRG